MYFNFACPSCSKNLRVRDELAGRNARCPYCKHQVTVPDKPAPEPESVPSFDLASMDLNSPSFGAPAESRGTTPAEGPALGGFGGTAPRTNELRAPVAKALSKPGSATTPAGRGAFAASANRPTAKPKGNQQTRSNDDGTNISMVWTSAIGLLFTVIFYAALAPIPANYFRDLFFNRGWVTVAEAFFMFWAIAILILKSRKLVRQRESMLFDLLPENISKDISLRNVDKFTEHVRDIPVDTGASFLVRRVLRGLEHYSVRGSASEVSTILSSQSELDNAAVGSSYGLLNVFIWAIPILGFIGTVQGLGNAVGNLSGSLEAASDVDSIKKSLGAITGGLGVAFDTTLVALIMSLFLKFPASSLQKAEEDLLNWVEEYCNENLLKRLVDEESSRPSAPLTSEATLNQAINAALIPHQAELRAWTARLQEIGKSLTDEITQGWTTMQGNLQSVHAERLNEFQTAVVSLGTVTTQMASLTEQLQQTQQQQAAWAHQMNDQLTTQATAGHQQVAALLQQSTQSLDEQFGLLQAAVVNLNDTLGQLNGKQVVIQVQHPPQRGWFGR